MEALTPWHLLLVMIGFVVLFGYKKLPDASRSIGRSLRIFRSEMHSLADAAPSEQVDGGVVGSAGTPDTLADLEAQAAAAEAHAAQLRERARLSSSRRDPSS